MLASLCLQVYGKVIIKLYYNKTLAFKYPVIVIPGALLDEHCTCNMHFAEGVLAHPAQMAVPRDTVRDIFCGKYEELTSEISDLGLYLWSEATGSFISPPEIFAPPRVFSVSQKCRGSSAVSNLGTSRLILGPILCPHIRPLSYTYEGVPVLISDCAAGTAPVPAAAVVNDPNTSFSYEIVVLQPIH
ncbi:hypothetical protein TNIN_456831 [Trichonephila inaurata madagascariensis]|uniref:Uncharacterized protein n=1 Tax=Trichonephila inaurata madagascariensis TaxID=2747483 RepID=A0A8X7CRB7_9ARAC|nr:hypothetical protein TNIN_456831 [Trichonephila inaurata madagascariensis]